MMLTLAIAKVAVVWNELSPARARPAQSAVGRRRGAAVRRVCVGCEKQRAHFRHHGVVKWDRYHTLCQRCFKSHADALKALPIGAW